MQASPVVGSFDPKWTILTGLVKAYSARAALHNIYHRAFRVTEEYWRGARLAQLQVQEAPRALCLERRVSQYNHYVMNALPTRFVHECLVYRNAVWP